jgi:predicted DNA-binding transcriptional regulator YafY
MAQKKDPYSGPGEKVITLFARLLFTREKHSLTELARLLNCSKQTVLRNIDAIRKAYMIEIEESVEGRRKYYRIKRPAVPPRLTLTPEEMSLLLMCRTFTAHLLGDELFAESERAVEKSMALVEGGGRVPDRHFASLRMGRIDYTPHAGTIRRLVEAMNRRRTCEIRYRAAGAGADKTLYVNPLKLFSRNDTLYLHGMLARRPGKKWQEPEFNPILAVHRMAAVKVGDRGFLYPEDYDFERDFDRHFGLVQDDPLEVTVEFSPRAADYAGERVWSERQEMKRREDGSLLLTFTAGSTPELMAKILSFGEEARIVAPGWLAEEMREKIGRMAARYGDHDPPPELRT